MMSRLRQILIPKSFSLRSLMLAVAASAIWLGYEVNWVRQRHAFLDEQMDRHLNPQNRPWSSLSTEEMVRWWNEQLGNSSPPWPLRLFGEVGVARLWIVVPKGEVTIRAWENVYVQHGGDANHTAAAPANSQRDWDYRGEFGTVQWPEICSLQSDLLRAKRLFPEAQIRPMAHDDMMMERDGVGHSGPTLHPGVTVRNPLKPTTLRWVCELTAVENSVFIGRFELNKPLEGIAIINYRTEDRTATSRQGNYGELSEIILAEPGQESFPFKINIGALTDEQRAAGGATFKITLGVVVGAIPDTKDKVIKIIPGPNVISGSAKAEPEKRSAPKAGPEKGPGKGVRNE